MNIKNEAEIEEELNQQYNVQLDEKSTRSKIGRLGERLVNSTEDVLTGVKKFINTFNKALEFVQLETFVYEEADYAFVSEKEVTEVREIFKAFDIHIKDLNCSRK